VLFSHLFVSISVAPPAVIFINSDLSPQVLGVFQSQLFINQTMDGPTFDANLAADGYYAAEIIASGQRILVLRDLVADTNNREYATIVLYGGRNGMCSVLSCKYGPPNITLPTARVYLTNLIVNNRPQPADHCPCRCRPFAKYPYGNIVCCRHKKEVLNNDVVYPHCGDEITREEEMQDMLADDQ
jgi:hypothetical protein